MFSIITSIIVIIIVCLIARSGISSGSFSTRLKKLLICCVDEGIISEEQQQKILDYIEAQKSGLRIKGTTWIAILSGLFVVAGVSLIVAHNWDQIGPTIRVIAYVLILAITGELTLRFQKQRLAISMPLELFWFFLPLIGIGLYAQTFQLSGDPIRPYLLWLVLTLPIAWASPHKVIGPLHLLILVAILFKGNFSPGNELSIVVHYKSEAHFRILPWIISFSLIALALVESFWRMPADHRKHIIGALVVWVVMLLITHTPMQVKHGGWLALAIMSGSSLWLLTLLFFRSNLAEIRLPQLVWILTLYGITFFWHQKSPVSGDYSIFGILIIIILALLSIVMTFILNPETLRINNKWAHFAKGIILAAILLPILLISNSIILVKAGSLAANFLFASVGIAFMWHGSVYGNVSQINKGVLIVLLLLITRFIDVFGTLLQGGLGFIISGLTLALLAYLLEKSRKRLVKIAQLGDTP